MDDLEEVIKEYKTRERPKIGDDHVKIHSYTLYITQLESELAYLYRSTLKVKHEIESSKYRAKTLLEDKHTEAMGKPTFKTLNGYMSRPEIEVKLRALAIEETYEFRIWESLMIDVNYLLDVVRSFQQEASRERRDIDTRLRLLGLY